MLSSLCRLWKYGNDTIGKSEFLLDSSLIEMLEFDDDIFAAGSFKQDALFPYFLIFTSYVRQLL